MSADEIAARALEMSVINKTWSEAHEKVCAQRYGEITDSLKDQSRLLRQIGVGVFVGIVGILGTYIFQYGVVPQMKERVPIAERGGK